MHAHLLVPLLAAVAALAVAGAAWGRDPSRPANRLAAAFLLCAGLWALCNALTALAGSPRAALAASRLSGLGFLWFGPLCVHLHAVLDPPAVDGRLRLALPWAYAATPLWIALYAGSDWFVAGVRAGGHGWLPVFGPAFPAAVAWVASYPLAFAAQLVLGRHRARFDAWGLGALPAVLAALVGLAFVTEVILPMAGVDFPRLGMAAVSVVAGAILLAVYRMGRGELTPRDLPQDLLDAFPDGVALLGPGGRIRSANANLAQLAGVPRAALRGMRLAQLVPGLDLEGRAPDQQRVFVPLEGAEFPISLAVSRLHDDDGPLAGHVVAVRDLRPALQLSGRLVTTGRLAAVGELAAAITHEINNPISFVRTNLTLLDSHLQELAKAAVVLPGCDDLVGPLGEARETVADTLRGADRVAGIVRDVRNFSGAGHGERETVEVNRLCEEALRVSLARLPQGVSLVRAYGEVPAVACSPRALVQVLLNLLTNAAQAVAHQGTIRITTTSGGGQVVIGVEDDGPGIAPEVMQHVFDPFFTTKPVGEGTGLGLAISREIIEDHGGTLDVQARAGGGTVFRVRLPAVGAPGGEGA